MALRAGRAVVLVGPPGIGKTTTTVRSTRGVDHLVARCLPAFSSLPYRPLSHALGQGLLGSVDEVATDVVATLGDRALVVEDVHWADPSTVEVLGVLIGRVPMIVTTRSAGPFAKQPVAAGMVDEIVIVPLEPHESTELARKLHPDLSEAKRSELVDLAGGNPLLIEQLARDGEVSSSVRDAVAARVAELPVDVVDELGRLALMGGVPAADHAVESLRDLDGDLTVAAGDGSIWFRHHLVAAAVLDALDDARLDRLRRELARVAPPAIACRQLLALGERSAAADAARRAADDADRTERADLLTLAVEALGDDAPARLLLDAAAAAVDAHRPDDVRRFADAVHGNAATRAEAGLHRARAAWLDGDPAHAAEIVEEALARVTGTDSRIEAELLVERAFIAVRRRVGDPTIVELADHAVEVAERAGVARARALNTAGLARSHVGRSGWRELFEEASRVAVEEDDDEEQLAAKYWLLSALGFYGPMPDAQALGAEMVAETGRRRARRWYHHFLGAHLFHLSGRGEVPPGRIADAHAMLGESPRFRNRAQVELALVVAHLDQGDLDECERIVTAGDESARSGEDVALLACARCEIALARRDVDGMRDALAAIAVPGIAFFGLNAVAESAAINLAFGRPGEIDPPATVTTLTPVLDVVAIEREAHDRQLAGDVDAAIRLCRSAAEQWAARGLDRFARRARLAQVEIAVASSDLDLGARLLATVPRGPQDVSGRRRSELDATVARLRARSQVTRRELEVLELVGDGLTSRQIAERLGIGVSTVDTHVDTAMRRLGARTRVHAASLIGP